MKGSPREPHPIAEAVRWVGVITTIALEMILPGVVGHWLDRQFGLEFLTFVGFAFGLILGLWSLVRLGQQSNRESDRKNGR